MDISEDDDSLSNKPKDTFDDIVFERMKDTIFISDSVEESNKIETEPIKTLELEHIKEAITFEENIQIVEKNETSEEMDFSKKNEWNDFTDFAKNQTEKTKLFTNDPWANESPIETTEQTRDQIDDNWANFEN